MIPNLLNKRTVFISELSPHIETKRSYYVLPNGTWEEEVANVRKYLELPDDVAMSYTPAIVEITIKP